MNYLYTHYKDQHLLQNNQSINIGYTIFKVTCDATTTVSTGNIAPGNVVELKFTVDGQYNIDLYDANETDSFQVKTYNNLLLSFISNVEALLCGCSKCKDCEECNECETYLSAFMKAFSFNSFNTPIYDLYVNLIAEDSQCALESEVLCNILHEKVYGNATTKEPILQIIGFYYAAFYFKDFYSAEDSSEQEFITTKYKYDKIAKCMKKLGIDPAQAIQEFESSSTVYYYQLDSLTDTIFTENALLNSMYLSTKPSSALSVFEEGKIVNYSGVAKIAFVIMPTASQNFVISDSLNNDVTDDFVSLYDVPTNRVIFVSKLPYSNSSIYFKFKKGL
jgi:hypothetical protein